MKKEYTKPSVLIQNMTINSFAAGLCTDKDNAAVHYWEDTCTFTDEESGMTYFSDNCETGDEWSINIVNPNPQSPYAQLCYHRPLDAVLPFFAS